MTQPGPPPPPADQPYYLTPEPGSELDQLMTELDLAKAEARDAADRADTLVRMVEDAAGKEAARRLGLPPDAPLPRTISLAATATHAGRRMHWMVPLRFARKAFDQDHPGVYRSYSEYGEGYWQLDPEQ